MLRESSEYNVDSISIGKIWGMARRMRARDEVSRALQGRKVVMMLRNSHSNGPGEPECNGNGADRAGNPRIQQLAHS